MTASLPPLEEHPFLRGLSPGQVKAIACGVREVSFPAGTLLLSGEQLPRIC